MNLFKTPLDRCKPQQQGIHTMPQNTLRTTVAVLSRDISNHAEQLSKHEQAILETREDATKALHAATEVKKLVSGETLAKARADAHEIHALYRTVMLKVSVATEVVFLVRTGEGADPNLARDLALAIVLAFDLPNSWWLERESLVLKDWVKLLTRIARKGIKAAHDIAATTYAAAAEELQH